jgi:hypothetical protein
MNRSPSSNWRECAMQGRPGRARISILPLAFAIMLGAFVAAAPASGALYKWTDANGRVVYSDQPPPGDMKVDVIAGPPPPSNPNAAKDLANKEVESKKQQQEAAANSKKALQQRADAEKRVDACKSARAEISRLAADQIILYSVNEKGETIVMNDADRRRRRETLETFIRTNCPQG